MIKKIIVKSGVNTENTRYLTEGGYWESDKIRFRQGTPQTIGGWAQTSSYTYQGTCRSLWNWVTIGGITLTGVGTNLKFYVQMGGGYYDVTPIRTQATLTNPFTATTGSTTITVSAPNHGAVTGDFVTYNGATGLGGNISAAVLNGVEFQVTYISANSYSIVVSTPASALDTGHGGTVNAVYQINTGTSIVTALTGWGAGTWGSGTWGYSSSSNVPIRLWSQMNFGEDLIFAPRGGGIYYYDSSYGVLPYTATITIASPAVITTSHAYDNYDVIYFSTTGALPTGLTAGVPYYVRNVSGVNFNVSATPTGALINTSGTQSGIQSVEIRATNLANLYGADSVPTVQNFIMVSDLYRYVFAFGCNDIGETAQNPLLIRWSDQEDAANWNPINPTSSQAGSLPLSRGSKIVSALQNRQEIMVWTDTALYSMQYLGAPLVWGAQLMSANTSIVSQNAAGVAANVVYWMGVDKFYKYDGRVQTLRCDLLQQTFSDLNQYQADQIFCGTVERFSEVWWFYPSANSDTVNKYVVYNYIEDIWYYGTLARTAWLDSGIIAYPLAAGYYNNTMYHEYGVDDNETSTTKAINAYITTSEFDLDADGHNFMFIRRVLPDLTFRGSTATSPSLTLTLMGLDNSGSGYNNPASLGGVDYAGVTRTATAPIEEFTGQVYIRVRGRQFAFKLESNQIGCAWQSGAMRFDFQADGRRA